LDGRLAELDNAEGIDDASATAARDIYGQAKQSLLRAADFTRQATEFQRLAADAPQLLETIRQELSGPIVPATISVPDNSTLQQLEQALTQAAADLEAARLTASGLQAEATNRSERRSTLSAQLSSARQQLADFQDPTSLQQSDGEHVIVAEARRTLAMARSHSLEQEILALEAEASSYEARRELLPARRDRAQRRVSEAEQVVAAWQEMVTSRRQSEADRTAEDAQRMRREAARQHPVLKNYADATAERASTRRDTTGLASRIAETTQETGEIRTEMSSLQAQFASIQRRLNASGLNRATGILLRRQNDELPSIIELARRIRLTQSALEKAEYDLIELQDERLAAGDIDRVTNDLLAQITSEVTGTSQSELEATARELAVARRDLLDQQVADATVYFERLVDLNSAQRTFLNQTESYRSFIEERILWVRSVASEQLFSLEESRVGIQWLTSPHSWEQVARATWSYVGSSWMFIAMWTLFLAALWSAAVPLIKKLNDCVNKITNLKNVEFRHTFLVFFITLCVAVPGALTIYSAGLLLGAPDGQVELGLSIATGLQSAALLFYPLSLLQQILRKNGLAESHFRWPSTSFITLKRNLRWFTPTVVLLSALVITFDSGANDQANASLGRVLFTGELLAVSFFLHRILRSGGPLFKAISQSESVGWIYKLRRLWHLLGVLTPLLFVLLSWLGFHYTALRLESRFEQTLVLVLVLVLLNGLMLRWLLIARKRVALEEARRKRDQSDADGHISPGGDSEREASVPVIDENKLDLPALSDQTRQLFKAAIAVSVLLGLYAIWAEALPALRMLDRVQLWPAIEIVQVQDLRQAPIDTIQDSNGGSETSSAIPATPTAQGLVDSAGDSRAQLSQARTSITVADLGLFSIVLLATWALFRNAPGLVEIVVLQRLPLDSGSRYALSTVFRYAIAIIGVSIAFSVIGLSWSKVQWLAAALTFGLAFGLQEIFANFVSGLIILAERPIRLSDTVTVGGVTGTVTRIRMRATTISDWDRKELVIPNKTFITGELINWSLTDPVLRVIITVGVSYSSDVDKVERVLLQVAEQNNVVLSDPKPQVIFRNFGDSTLDFELRVFIPNIDHLQPINHQMRMAIAKAFRQAGIEIAFPQRDLHLRSTGDLVELAKKRCDLNQQDSETDKG
jgi:potassium efflux system protein